ncbi:MAG: phosphotransferase [Lachnospiraceae bacterium]|nr:phosphotransferase [Lachnospiraceae bacterium]
MSDPSLTPGKHFPADLTPPSRGEVLSLLAQYGYAGAGDVRLIDTSHDADDIRLNYIIGRRFVLRLVKAPDMTEQRLADLNRLIGRYRDFGLFCPAFLPDPKGRFFHARGPLSVYLAEYADFPLMYDLMQEKPPRIDSAALWQEVLDSVALFAERYRNVDLSGTMGMYSLFDLSPFDKEEGIDEKQQNFDRLIRALNDIGETSLAARLTQKHDAVRAALRAVYKSLPRCVFQGDENSSNVLVRPDGHLAGFIDFNLSGTEVIVNQFANLGGGFLEEVEEPVGAAVRLEHALADYRRYQGRMMTLYHATETEKTALGGYTWIALAAGWPQVCFFLDGLKNEKLKDEVLELLGMLADLPEEALIL